MLTLNDIGTITRNNVQLILDQLSINLAVGDINDDDYRILCGGFGELNWDEFISSIGNHEDRFEFCIKIKTVEGGVATGVPAGIALCLYSISENSFDIYAVENFCRNKPDHPLHGKMIQLTLMAAYLFSTAVKCATIRIIEPVQELLDFYAQYGFNLLPCNYIMQADVHMFSDIISKMAGNDTN